MRASDKDVFQLVIPKLIQKLVTESPISTLVPNMEEDSPPTGLHQRVQWNIDRPTDPVLGVGYHRENLEFQVFVFAPKGTGTLDLNAQTTKIRNAFRKGTTIFLDSEGVRILILETPQIAGVSIVQGYAVSPVLIPVTIEVYNF